MSDDTTTIPGWRDQEIAQLTTLLKARNAEIERLRAENDDLSEVLGLVPENIPCAARVGERVRLTNRPRPERRRWWQRG